MTLCNFLLKSCNWNNSLVRIFRVLGSARQTKNHHCEVLDRFESKTDKQIKWYKFWLGLPLRLFQKFWASFNRVMCILRVVQVGKKTPRTGFHGKNGEFYAMVISLITKEFRLKMTEILKKWIRRILLLSKHLLSKYRKPNNIEKELQEHDFSSRKNQK